MGQVVGASNRDALHSLRGFTSPRAIRADSVKKLVDSVVSFQEHSREIIDEMRQLSTRNAEEIQDAVESGKRKIAALAAQGNALTHG